MEGYLVHNRFVTAPVAQLLNGRVQCGCIYIFLSAHVPDAVPTLMGCYANPSLRCYIPLPRFPLPPSTSTGKMALTDFFDDLSALPPSVPDDVWFECPPSPFFECSPSSWWLDCSLSLPWFEDVCPPSAPTPSNVPTLQSVPSVPRTPSNWYMIPQTKYSARKVHISPWT